MTDWLSTGEDRADEAGCLNAGVDLIMPGGKKVVKALLNAYKEGCLSLDTLRQSCGWVLEKNCGPEPGLVSDKLHDQLPR